MASPSPSFTVGSLYIAGFAQAQAPHDGLILPLNAKSARLVHIRIDRDISSNWVYQARNESLTNNMFLSSLLKIHDVSDGEITPTQLEEAAKEVSVPDNDSFGECGPWICKVIEELHRRVRRRRSWPNSTNLLLGIEHMPGGTGFRPSGSPKSVPRW